MKSGISPLREKSLCCFTMAITPGVYPGLVVVLREGENSYGEPTVVYEIGSVHFDWWILVCCEKQVYSPPLLRQKLYRRLMYMAQRVYGKVVLFVFLRNWNCNKYRPSFEHGRSGARYEQNLLAREFQGLYKCEHFQQLMISLIKLMQIYPRRYGKIFFSKTLQSRKPATPKL